MHVNRHLPTALILAAIASPILIQAPAAAQTRVTGRVVNDKGQALAKVFVQQQGSLATAFTDDQGRFTITLDPNGQRSVEVSAVGYQSKVATVDGLAARPIKLDPIPTYQPTYASVVPARVAPQIPLLDTQVGASYQLLNPRLSQGGQAVEGWVDNALYGHGQLRRGNALIGLEGSRYKAPMDLPNSPTTSSVATPEVTDVKVRGGMVFGNELFEVGPSLSVFQTNVTPNNNGVPYSGTVMDYTHTRRGFGLAVPAIVTLGRFDILGEGAYYPWTATSVEDAPAPITSGQRIDLKLGVGYRFTPNVRAELGYTNQMWRRGDFRETTDVWGLGITYRPERTEERQ
ncbi:hypothetical protein D3C86_487350 [compost metagenome]